MKCHICGCKLAESENGLEAHMKRYHAVNTLPKPKFRPKAEVVAEWEDRNAHMLIDPLRVACPEGCKCNACFQVALDKLVKSSGEGLNDDSGTGSIVLNDVASY